MRRARFFAAVVAAIYWMEAASASNLHGRVYLLPITSQFTSDGQAEYLDDLQYRIDTAELRGTHSVHGPQVFEAAVSSNNGYYSYLLEGPVEPGACYGTTLEVTGDAPYPYPTYSRRWTDDTRCAPAPPPETPDEGNSCPPGGCPGSPIILDLGGDNYRLTSLDDGVVFDLRNEGHRSQMSWTQEGVENAFLALDRNGNGRIDNGSELFGDYTLLESGERAENGFVALVELDDNGDRIIDVRDEAWGQLLLWTDRNHNGLSSSDELQAVAESAVVAMETDYQTIGMKDRWGNLFRFVAKFRLRDGSHVRERKYYDIFLRLATL